MSSFRNLYFFKDGLFRNYSISCALLSASAQLQVWPTSWLSRHLQLQEVYFFLVLTAGLRDASCLWRTAVPQILRLVGLLGEFMDVFLQGFPYYTAQFIASLWQLPVLHFAISNLSSLKFLTIKLHLKLSLRSKSVSKRKPFRWQNWMEVFTSNLWSLSKKLIHTWWSNALLSLVWCLHIYQHMQWLL